jgi:hypothetical protein
MFISGPRSAALGSEQGTTSCALMMGQGGDHITSSAIFHYSNATCFYGQSFISSSGAVCFGGSLTGTSATFNNNSTSNAGFFQINDGTTTLGNSFATVHRNANDGNGRFSLSRWQVQNASGLDQSAFIGTQAVTGASNYNPNLILGISTGASSYATYLTITSTGAATFACNVTAGGRVYGTTAGLNSDFNSGGLIAYSCGSTLRYTQVGFDCTGNYGWIQALEQGVAYRNLVLNGAGGNVGIGLTNPSYTFDVNKSVDADFVARIANSSSTGFGLYVQTNDNTKPGIRIANASGVTGIDLLGTGAATFAGTISGGNNFELVNTGGPYVLVGEGTGVNQYAAIDWDATNNRLRIATQPFAFGANGGQITLTTGGNVGIGTTAPTNGKLEVQTGATAAGLWVQTGGTTSDYVIADFRTGTNLSALQILGNGVSSFGSNVGIGCTSPGYALDVRDGTTGSAGGRGMRLSVCSNSAGPQFRLEYQCTGDSRNWMIGTNQEVAGDFIIRSSTIAGCDPGGASSATRFSISKDGNVGIGTSSPSDFIDAGLGLAIINTSGRTALALGSTQGTANEVLGRLSFTNTNSTNIGNKRLAYVSGLRGTTNNSAYLEFGTANDGLGTQRMVIAQNGDVFIRTALRISDESTWGLSIYKWSTTGSPIIEADGGQALSFARGGVESMRITSGGNVYINAESNPLPDNATPQLGIIAGASTDAISIKHTQNSNNTLNIWQTGTANHNAIAFYKGDTQANRGNIVVSTSGTSYNTVSDYRLKENVTPLENGLDRLMQLKPSKFNWIETGNESEGFIAHELQEYFPDAVTGEKDAMYSSTGNIKPQSVDYGRITPLLVKALQEQQCTICSQASTINILKTCLGIN